MKENKTKINIELTDKERFAIMENIIDELIDCDYPHQEDKICGVCRGTNKRRWIHSIGVYAPSSLTVVEAEKEYQTSIDALTNRYKLTN